MPLFLLGLYFAIEVDLLSNFSKMLVFLYVLLVSVIVPLLFMWFLHLQKKVDSIMVPDIHQRKLPVLFQAFILLFLYYTFIKYPFFKALEFAFLSSAISVFIAFLLLFKNIKASLHQLGISGLLFFIILLSISNKANYTILISILFLVNGLVASSRLELKAHTPLELVIGAAIGTIPQLVLAPFWLF